MPKGSAELRDVYEAQYCDGGNPLNARAGAWRTLGAQGKADHVAALAGALPTPPRSVVEVGCGDGVVLAALAARGLGERRHGFEISERAVELAAGRPEIERVERFDGATLPAADGEYDLGVLSHVLEHVPDPVPLLRETARVARAVVVEVPLEANRSASRSEAERGREAIGHLHRFSRADVHALARRRRAAGGGRADRPAAVAGAHLLGRGGRGASEGAGEGDRPAQRVQAGAGKSRAAVHGPLRLPADG